ncbi:MAG TPA: 3TM-type holin [Syntrophorhabdaceae bacterium]|nr:3TM-type holin [Syntrophorhabdaceae bacterium]
MDIIGTVLSGGIKRIFEGIGSLAKDIRQAITGEISPEKKAEIEQRAMEIEYAATKAQTDINLEEAKNQNLFVSGWRPFVGWICGLSLGWQFIGNPIFDWVVKLAGKNIAAPNIDTGSLITVLFAMLGLGGLRTYEKVKNAQENH